MSTRRPTSFDIAALAGVSQPTVSRALSGNPSVSAETRRRVLEAARELNYTVDKNASGLRTRQSRTIALLFFEDPTPDDTLINPFYLSMVGAMTRACAQRRSSSSSRPSSRRNRSRSTSTAAAMK